MNVGGESRGKLIAGVSLAAIAVIVVAGSFSGWFGMSSSAAAPSASASAVAASDPLPAPAKTLPGRRLAPTKKGAEERSLDPSLRLDLLKSSEQTKYEGTGRNIFAVFVEIPKPLKNPVTQPPVQVVQQGPSPTPPPPPINLVFYGFATPAGGAKRVFLAQGEDVFIAKEGDIVDRRYKVVRISANAVEILDVLSNNRQSIPLTQG